MTAWLALLPDVLSIFDYVLTRQNCLDNTCLPADKKRDNKNVLSYCDGACIEFIGSPLFDVYVGPYINPEIEIAHIAHIESTNSTGNSTLQSDKNDTKTEPPSSQVCNFIWAFTFFVPRKRGFRESFFFGVNQKSKLLDICLQITYAFSLVILIFVQS